MSFSRKLYLMLIALSLSLLLLLPTSTQADADNSSQSQGTYNSVWQAVLSGSDYDTTSNYMLLSAFAQPIVGVAGGAEYFMASGFVSDSAPIPVKVVEVETPTLPESYTLAQNYPNPFNPTTTIEFSLPRSGFVVLEVFDITGRKVVTLVSEELKAGVKRVTWDGRDRTGAEAASGVYFYRLKTENFSDARKMLLLK